MVDQKIEQEPDASASVENALSALWEKAREASLLISTLREEKRQLLLRVEELEEELSQSHSDITARQTQLDQLRSEPAVERSNDASAIKINDEEKRMLEQKLKSVIGKIEQYLSS